MSEYLNDIVNTRIFNSRFDVVEYSDFCAKVSGTTVPAFKGMTNNEWDLQIDFDENDSKVVWKAIENEDDGDDRVEDMYYGGTVALKGRVVLRDAPGCKENGSMDEMRECKRGQKTAMCEVLMSTIPGCIRIRYEGKHKFLVTEKSREVWMYDLHDMVKWRMNDKTRIPIQFDFDVDAEYTDRPRVV
jgi:hypothetical protein